MVNDTTTLNGALQELGETMAANLVTKGVQASASDGLTTLAGKILDISGGGVSCYHIEFSESSYTAVGGSCTVEVYLQSNYAPLSGATVTVTGSDSSLYTGITDSSGVATVTVSVNSETTFTATYQGASATCTVTVGPSYLFYDDCTSSTGLSNYSMVTLRGSPSPTLTFDSTNSCYVLANNARSSGGQSMMAIDSLAGENSYTMQFKTKPYNTTDNGGTGYAYKGSNGMYSIYYTYNTGSSDSGNITINQGSSDSVQTNIGSNHRDEWLTHILTVSNGKVTYVLKDSADTVLYNGSAFSPSKQIQSDTKPGVTILWWNLSKVFVKEIIVEAL